MWFLPERFLRLALALVGLVSVLFAPWWLPLACMVLLSLRYAAWEVPLIGVAMDLLWLPAGWLVHPFPLFTVGALLLVWGFEPLRRQFLVS
jgi:hypothetical protein